MRKRRSAMSRQADNYFCDKFEIYGEEYSLVEPECVEDLMKAYEIRDLIQNYHGNLMSDDDTKDSWLDLLQEQNDNIQAYLENLGEFDNSILVSNVTHLTKKYGMHFGDLEAAIGLSAGYISRTAKTDSKKKMSIDVVWKISKLFEIDIKSLIERDLSVPERGVDILVKFIEKLTNKTIAGEITWENHGGYMDELNPRYENLGLLSFDEQADVASYKMGNFENDHNKILLSDVYCYRNFQKGKDLVIISYTIENIKDYRAYDFYVVKNEHGREKADLLFGTAQDAFAGLKDLARELIDTVSGLEFEPMMTKEHRSMIEEFLKED